MILSDNLFADIKDAVGSTYSTATVATCAEMMNFHYFQGQQGLIGGFNRGRKIAVYVERLDSIYGLDSIVDGGQVDSRFRLTFIASKPSNSRATASESQLYAVATGVAKALRLKDNWKQMTWTTNQIESLPFGYQLVTEIAISNSWKDTNL